MLRNLVQEVAGLIGKLLDDLLRISSTVAAYLADAFVNWIGLRTTPKALWTYQAESQLSHQIGRAEADGWSVNVLDTPGKFMCYGPYTTAVPPGRRTASFRVMLDNVTADDNRILTFDVYDSASNRVLARRDVNRRDFSQPIKYQGFNVDFTASKGQCLEFRTWWYGGSYAREDRVDIG